MQNPVSPVGPCQPAGAGAGRAGGAGQGRARDGSPPRAHPGGRRCAGRPGPAAHAAAQEHGRAGGGSRRLRQGLRGAGLGRRQHGLVRQPVERVDGDVGRLHAARGGRGDVRRSLCRPGLGRAPRQEQGDPRRGRLSAHRHLELRQRRAPHQDAGRAQRRAEPRRHAAYPLRPAGRPLVRLPAQPGQDHRRLARARACAAPAATATRSRTCSFPTRTRRRATSTTSGASRGRSIPSARPCSTPAASAASPSASRGACSTPT